MSHLDEGILHALLDGETPSDEAAQARAHLAACGECRRRLEEARGFLDEADALIGAYEVPAASQDRAYPVPAPARRRVRLRHLAWAATIVLAVGTGYMLRGLLPLPLPRPAEQSVAAVPEPARVTPPADAAAPSSDLRSEERARPATPTAAPAPATESRAAGPADDGRAQGLASLPEPAVRRDADRDAVAAKEGKLEAAAPAEGEERIDLAARQRAAAPDAGARNSALGGVASADRAAPAKRLADEAVALPLQAAAPRSQAAAGAGGGFRQISLEEGVGLLGGTIRLIDGLAPARVETAPGGTVPGTRAGTEIVRVVYGNDATRLIVLDQQRVGGGGGGRDAGQAFRAVEPVSREQRRAEDDADVARVTWSDPHGFLFVLSGPVARDSLLRLQERVR